ncbi:MAG: hypothetical protein HYR85_16280 [Planctomycetes bacterium]|nr:hypothetical protein [Planctomycetota bacterium]MBI3845484.1 hypothetical protein [Planctomycetota bacterium]
MTRALVLLSSALLALAPITIVRAADDPPKGPTEGVLRIYVTDTKGEPVAGGKASVTAYLDYGGLKKTVTLDPVEPKKGGDVKDPGAGKHGGQVVKTDDDSVELLVVKDAASRPVAAPAFEARIPLVVYQDSMKDAPPSETPGSCPKCGMAMEAHSATFSAVVTVKSGEHTVTAKGFHYPADQGPKSIADAAKMITGNLDRIDALITSGKLAGIRKVAKKVTGASKTIVNLAAARPAGEQATVKKAAEDIADTCAALTKSAKANNADDCKKAVARLRALVASLPK